MKRYLNVFGAVLIEGPKWCGKTTTALQSANSVLYLQDPRYKDEYQRRRQVEPYSLLEGKTPRLIDEWQMAPELWDCIRFKTDEESKDGLFILTGSTVVDESTISHSGAGRIKRMRMSTMSLFESGDSTGDISLEDLFDGKDISGHSELTLNDIAKLTIRGGWPKTIDRNEKEAYDLINGYCETLLRSDIITVDGVKRNERFMSTTLRSISRNISTPAPDTTIKADIESNEGVTIHINTLRSYLDALRELFVIQDLTAWTPKLRSKATVRTSDTRHFCDPAIAAHFLRASPKNLMDDLRTFGLLFESLAVRDLRAYAGSIGGEVYHYRDSDGLEADAIVHLHDGRWGAIEVKLGDGMIDEAASNLLKLKNKVKTESVGEPSFLAVITGTSSAYRTANGIYVIPLGCLRA